MNAIGNRVLICSPSIVLGARKLMANKPRVVKNETKRPVRNLLASLGVDHIDYKDTAKLRVFISERGKIRSRRVTGLTV
jgi:ribosomal protein S18